MKKLQLLIIIITILQNLKAQNNALSFFNNGLITNSVSLVYHPALDFNINDKFTIEAWVKTSDSHGVVFSNKLKNAPYTGYEMAIRNGVLTFEFTNDYFTNKLEMRQLLSCNDGYWHHLAVVYNGTPAFSTVKLYYNGLDLTTNVLSSSLSGTTITGNAPFIGTGGYPNDSFFNGSIDELRVWNKALCQTEIDTYKNCQLTGTEVGLAAYYKFNQGVAASNNAGVNTLVDAGPYNLNGTLSGFMLGGTTSNWLASTASISGVCNPVVVNPSVSGSSVSCKGDLVSLSVNGAQSYTWMPGPIYGAQVLVNPTVTTTYTISASTAGNCLGLAYHTQNVNECAGFNINSDLIGAEVIPNPFANTIRIIGIEPGSTVSVFNNLGQLVYESQNSGDLIEVDFTGLSNGMYYLDCVKNNKHYKRKLIKNKPL